MAGESGEQEARAALDDVRRRQEAVGRELGRHRPRWWMTAMYVLGMYLVMASVELGAGYSLLVAGGGFALLAGAVGLAVSRAAKGGVGGPRTMWSPLRVAATAAWLVAIFGVFLLVRTFAEGYLAEWQAPIAAAAPAAGVAWLFALWVWRLSFGPRPEGTGRAA